MPGAHLPKSNHHSKTNLRLVNHSSPKQNLTLWQISKRRKRYTFYLHLPRNILSNREDLIKKMDREVVEKEPLEKNLELQNEANESSKVLNFNENKIWIFYLDIYKTYFYTS